MMVLNANDFKPRKKSIADFFSWQLYLWLRKYPDRCSVYAATWNPVFGIDKDKRTLFIGTMDHSGPWFHGKQLKRLCLYGQSLEAYAYGPMHDTENWADVTQEFWEKYKKIGVCAIHDDLAHEWKYVTESHRTCIYCNKNEFKSIKIIEKEIWRGAA